MSETLEQYHKRMDAERVKKYLNGHWMPEKRVSYIMGVPYPVEDIDDKDKSTYKDPEGIW